MQKYGQMLRSYSFFGFFSRSGIPENGQRQSPTGRYFITYCFCLFFLSSAVFLRSRCPHGKEGGSGSKFRCTLRKRKKVTPETDRTGQLLTTPRAHNLSSASSEGRFQASIVKPCNTFAVETTRAYAAPSAAMNAAWTSSAGTVTPLHSSARVAHFLTKGVLRRTFGHCAGLMGRILREGFSRIRRYAATGAFSAVRVSEGQEDTMPHHPASGMVSL